MPSKASVLQERAARLRAAMLDDGYTDLTICGPDLLCGLGDFVYTAGLMVGLDFSGYERRYCYEHAGDARAALQAWDGTGHPGGPWIKCKGLGVDLLNPEFLSENEPAHSIQADAP